MSRDISWGIYIGQFTFFVGIAASAVMVVLPYYFHDVKEFGRITILGEFLAIAAVIMCMLFIFVDMGQPARVLNVLFYPTLHSMMFWDMISLGGYLLLNAIISAVMLDSEYKHLYPPRWLRPVILLSVPWAISIHTVTAFLYNGLPGRSLWLHKGIAPDRPTTAKDESAANFAQGGQGPGSLVPQRLHLTPLQNNHSHGSAAGARPRVARITH